MKCLFEKLYIKKIYLWCLNMLYKEYGFYQSLIKNKHEVFVTGTVDEIHLLAVSENEVELITNVVPHKKFCEILP